VEGQTLRGVARGQWRETSKERELSIIAVGEDKEGAGPWKKKGLWNYAAEGY